MAKQAERRKEPRPKKQQQAGAELESQLSAQEQQELEGQLKEVQGAAQEGAKGLEAEYRTGQAILKVKRSALWRRARRLSTDGYQDFIHKHVQVPRSTMEPRVLIAREFTPADLVVFIGLLLCMSVVAELARARPALRDELLAIIKAGATYAQIRAARVAGNKILKQRAQPTEPPLTPEERIAQARAAMHLQQAEALVKAAAARANKAALKAGECHCACHRCDPEGPLDGAQGAHRTQLGGTGGQVVREGIDLIKQGSALQAEGKEEVRKAQGKRSRGSLTFLPTGS